MNRDFSLGLSPEKVMAKKRELENKIAKKERSIKSSINAEEIKEIEQFYKDNFEGITHNEAKSFINSIEEKYMKKFIMAQLEDQELKVLKDELKNLQPAITRAAQKIVSTELQRMFRLEALHHNDGRIHTRRI